jgi:hypothetical protein
MPDGLPNKDTFTNRPAVAHRNSTRKNLQERFAEQKKLQTETHTESTTNTGGNFFRKLIVMGVNQWVLPFRKS